MHGCAAFVCDDVDYIITKLVFFVKCLKQWLSMLLKVEDQDDSNVPINEKYRIMPN